MGVEMRAALTLACVLGLTLAGGAPAGADTLVKSSFTSSADGWTVTNRSPAAPPTHHATGGTPDGYISISDMGPKIMYWNAPAKFLGNQSQATHLQFGAQQSALNSPAGTEKWLVLKGNGLTLTKPLGATSPPSVAPAWVFYGVNLTGSNFTDQATGMPPSDTQFHNVLHHLTALKIQAEYRLGPDVDGLDEVQLQD
jgi:hypothetical protein